MTSIYDNLTLAMGRKTDKIKSLKADLCTLNKRINLSCIIASIFGVLAIMNSDDYYNYFESVFDSITSVNRSVATESLSKYEIIILVAIALSVYFIYSLLSRKGKLKDQFENLRKDIIDSIDNQFCNHNQSCSCKDDYIIEMDKFDIDVVLK